jgi:acetolactate synthase-1/2/3 large subunit
VSAAKRRRGAEILVEQLRLHGVDRVFAVPGESYLAVLDALYDTRDIELIVGRQEGGTAMMAEAHGKLTGRPGICFVTRAPGATSASAGVHVAFQDSTPMILFIGQVARGTTEREAFQEIDYRRMYGPLAKWVAEIDDAARIPELVGRAFYTATAGRPGPVVLSLPEDMLSDLVAASDAAPHRPVQAHPGPEDMDRLQTLLNRAERPFMILGGGGWDAGACADIAAFAESQILPAGVSFRCQDYFDNTHPNYAGHVGLAVDAKLTRRIRESDLLLVVGARLGEITTAGYTLIEPPRPAQSLVHVHPGAEELGRVYQPELAINAGMAAFAAAARKLAPDVPAGRRARVEAAHADYLEQTLPVDNPGALQLSRIVAWLRDRLPPEAIITNGAGNYTVWVHRFYQFRRYRSQLAPTSGSMGYGLPAAVAAKAAHPERPVVCFAGDGCFLMHGQELATAVKYGLGIVVLVVNNAMYGTIRLHQEKEYPARVSGTDLVNPDFAAYARAFGAHGEVVERTEDFAPAFERALAAGAPALVELRVDPEALTPRASLSEIRAAALAARKA